MRKSTLALFVYLAGVLLPGTSFSQSTPAACKSMVSKIGMPQIKSEQVDYEILCRDGYLLAHDNERKTPAWVVERLTPSRYVGPGDRKKLGNPFAEDPDLVSANVDHATPKDYAKQKSVKQGRRFDQGHMAPAADMKFSVPATVQSFYMSNMAPQQGSGLNRHIWADLEKMARDWSCDRGDLYVITGPIYDEDDPDTLGGNAVAVPTAFYKMAFDPQRQRLISLILPNEAIDKMGQKSTKVLEAYITTLSEVERRTGIDFFAALDRREHRRLAPMKSVMWPVIDGCSSSE